ncbi:hypothetical protein LWI29_036472 [Acer saccharum]|uniref:Uncharacterized protein n=1 Tax=Acer saccharum TaxID=4024 RepID=A0AA39T2Z0_ACESA|nr:hypothetical protein LWI29_036472 [Acer saccharum]
MKKRRSFLSSIKKSVLSVCVGLAGHLPLLPHTYSTYSIGASMAKVEIDNYEEKKYTKSAWLVERRSREVLVWLKKEVGKSVIKQQNDKTHKADKRNSPRNQIIDC